MVTPIETNEIGFRAASFTWSNESNSGATTPSKRRFTLRVEEELLFKKGCINLIVGPTGALFLSAVQTCTSSLNHNIH